MIYKSDQIDKLAIALSGVQGELHDVYKGSKGYGYDYADLTAVLEVVRPLLKKYELSVTQPVSGSNNMIDLNTMLMHSSGQYISATISVPVDLTNKKMNSLQAAGSTITYLRRYCICSIIGIATTDDDGKAGGESLDKSQEEAKSKRVINSQPATTTIPRLYSPEQLKKLREDVIAKSISLDVDLSVVSSWYKKANVSNMHEFSGPICERLLQLMNNPAFNPQDGTVGAV